MPKRRASDRERVASIQHYLHQLRSNATDIEMLWPDEPTAHLLLELSDRLMEDRLRLVGCVPSVKSIDRSVVKMKDVLQQALLFRAPGSGINDLQHPDDGVAQKWQDGQLVRSWSVYVCSWVVQCLAIVQESDSVDHKVEDTEKKKADFKLALAAFWESFDHDLAHKTSANAAQNHNPQLQDLSLCLSPTAPAFLLSSPLTASTVTSSPAQSSASKNTSPISFSTVLSEEHSTMNYDTDEQSEADKTVPSLGFDRWLDRYEKAQGERTGRIPRA